MLTRTLFRGWIALGFMVGTAMPIAAPAAVPSSIPRRIVSLNLCADQLLVVLADPGQIAALTEWARDPMLSSVAGRAAALPFTHRSAEEVIALRPDLVIGAPYRTKTILTARRASAVRMIDLPQDESVAGIERAIVVMARAVGHPERGSAMIANMRRALAAIGPPPGRGRIAAYYQRQGYLSGTGTLVDELMRRVGLVNLSARLGRPGLSTLSLEEMALARPDFLVLDQESRGFTDRGSSALRHPLLDRAIPPRHRLYLPQALTVCPTPAFPQAVALVAKQVRDLDRSTR